MASTYLDIYRVVLTHQGERRLVVEVAALAAHVLMLLAALVYGSPPPLAVLLATRLWAFLSPRSALQ